MVHFETYLPVQRFLEALVPIAKEEAFHLVVKSVRVHNTSGKGISVFFRKKLLVTRNDSAQVINPHTVKYSCSHHHLDKRLFE